MKRDREERSEEKGRGTVALAAKRKVNCLIKMPCLVHAKTKKIHGFPFFIYTYIEFEVIDEQDLGYYFR